MESVAGRLKFLGLEKKMGVEILNFLRIWVVWNRVCTYEYKFRK